MISFNGQEKTTRKLAETFMGKTAIRNSYMVECSSKPDYLAKLENSFRSENIELNDESEQTESYQGKRANLINSYSEHIDNLVNLHKRYLNSAQSHGLESPIFAAYLLFSRAISILSYLYENIKNGYWYAGSMLRDIDETLDVALYFIASNSISTSIVL